MIPLLEPTAPQPRPPLLLAGFDRFLPTQRRLFDAWGEWREASLAEQASEVHYFHAADTQAELAACALWCKRELAANPKANLLVITQNLAERRGEIERAFLNFAATGASAAPNFEFSLGVPLSQVPLARGAYLLLRWLTNPIAENELDWLLSTGQIAADPQESIALQTYHARTPRPWPRAPTVAPQRIPRPPSNAKLPPAWVTRINAAQSRLAASAARPQSPLDWAELVPQLLESAGWPGARPLSSIEHQSRNRLQQTIESCASLGYDGRRVRWSQFLASLARALDETLFTPESREAPIQIAGPAESAGLTADAIWFMGASEAAWPSSGSTHPLLPLEVQREAKMPHATAKLDWELARAITHRLLRSAPQVNFSSPARAKAWKLDPRA